ncbi:hypothetical protein FB451DRAFT_1302772 [Mycena latifolia]|nr:hypothetical protein FB451DRAFT_1302772 [Mycena latifolia]
MREAVVRRGARGRWRVCDALWGRGRVQWGQMAPIRWRCGRAASFGGHVRAGLALWAQTRLGGLFFRFWLGGRLCPRMFFLSSAPVRHFFLHFFRRLPSIFHLFFFPHLFGFPHLSAFFLVAGASTFCLARFLFGAVGARSLGARAGGPRRTRPRILWRTEHGGSRISAGVFYF